MRRIKFITTLIIAMLLVFTLAIPAFADATRVVTIGQDLSDEQEAFIIKYFGADLSTAEVIYVNNQQERQYVGGWIPLEQIGNITISSAYVQPTSSGGIQVKTANLTYVTGNMIASVLSTAGVKNCNVVAAAPFPVSGTGALTGVMIAYQSATGQPLDEAKRDLAVQEFTVTQQAAQTLGDQEALQLTNAVKMQVIQQQVSPEDQAQITQIVDDVITNIEQNTTIDNSVTNIDNSQTVINNGLSEEDRQLIIDLATAIAKQDYQYEDVKETLQRVEENLSNETNISIVIDNTDETVINNENQNDNDASAQAEDGQEAEESILSDTNDDLIDAAYQSSTREEDIAAIEEAIASEEAQAPEEDSLYDMSNVEEYQEYTDDTPVYEYTDGQEAMPEDIYVEPAQEPVMDEQIYEDPAGQEAMPEDIYVEPAQEPVMDEQIYEEPVIEEPIVEEPIVEEPVVEDVMPAALPGGWNVYTEASGSALPEDVKAYFDQAMQGYVGMNLTPVAYLGRQVVAGENIQILCTGAPVVPDPVSGLYVATVYADLEGNAQILNVADFDLAKLEEETDFPAPEEALAGGWTFPDTIEAATLPDDAKAAFDAAAANLLGADYTPAALLGTKVIAGTEYAVLCHVTTVAETPASCYTVAFIAANADGSYSLMNNVTLDLADYNQ